MKVDSDITIIGAGPAGLSAAKTLEEQGVGYQLYAKEKHPCRNKPCGGFIPQRTVSQFDLSNIEDAYPINTVEMRFPGVGIKQVAFEESIGVNVSRGELGQKMLSNLGQAQPRINLGHEVRMIERQDGYCIIKITADQSDYEIASRLVIDASGAYPVAVKSGLVRPKLTGSQMGYGQQYHFEKESNADDFEPVNRFYYGHEFSPGGYAWVYPRKRTVVIGSGGLLARVKSDDKRVAEYIEELIKEPIIKEMLANATPVKKDAAPVPLGGQITPSYAGHILLAGDAAGHCSPISGEGIHYSLVAGKIAGSVAAEAVKESDFCARYLKRYQDHWKKAFGSDLKWGLWLQKRFTGSDDGESKSAFLESEKSCRVVAEMLIGRREVFSAMKAIAPSYLASKVKSVFSR
ncbi:NAD(P)/FAD-dependent oxidoreductase [Candidatus Thorarchaeota archaeon]|nr:MAG: NAD(P)/FAD-dependent oxidoreductase [Candidatus Thorarchaeota archaeon]